MGRGVATNNDTGYQKPGAGMDVTVRTKAAPTRAPGAVPRVAD